MELFLFTEFIQGYVQLQIYRGIIQQWQITISELPIKLCLKTLFACELIFIYLMYVHLLEVIWNTSVSELTFSTFH